MKVKHRVAPSLFGILLAVLAIIYLYPLILVIINSFKTFAQVSTNVIAFPTKLVFANYTSAFHLMHYPRLFFNTLTATTVGVVGVVILSSMAGFKLSRTKTTYSWVVFMVCIAPMMIPFHSFMIALVKIAKSLGFIGSTVGLGILYWGLGAPLALFLYHGFVKSIPKDLDDCATIDGASPLQAFFRIVFPLLQPAT